MLVHCEKWPVSSFVQVVVPILTLCHSVVTVDAGSNAKSTLGQKAAKLDRETEELKRARSPPPPFSLEMYYGRIKCIPRR